MTEYQMKDLEEEEQNMVLRQELLIIVNSLIDTKFSTLNQQELACKLRIAQPRVSLLRQKRADQFSLDKLVTFAERLGRRINLKEMRDE